MIKTTPWFDLERALEALKAGQDFKLAKMGFNTVDQAAYGSGVGGGT